MTKKTLWLSITLLAASIAIWQLTVPQKATASELLKLSAGAPTELLVSEVFGEPWDTACIVTNPALLGRNKVSSVMYTVFYGNASQPSWWVLLYRANGTLTRIEFDSLSAVAPNDLPSYATLMATRPNIMNCAPRQTAKFYKYQETKTNHLIYLTTN